MFLVGRGWGRQDWKYVEMAGIWELPSIGKKLGQRRYLLEKKNNSNGKWVSWISWKNRIVRVCEHQLIGLKFWEGRKMESRKKQ
jgi:hypothetical protein